MPGRDRHPRCADTAEGAEGTDAMRVETTRTAGTVRLRHAVAYTGSADDVVARATPFVAAARGRHEPVALAVRPATARALADVPPAGGLPGTTGGGDSAHGRARPLRRARTTPGRRSPPGGLGSCARSPAGAAGSR